MDRERCWPNTVEVRWSRRSSSQPSASGGMRIWTRWTWWRLTDGSLSVAPRLEPGRLPSGGDVR